MSESPLQNPEELRALVHTRMPFGKHAGRLLIDLPEPYLIWMIRNQLPEGQLGRHLLAMYEIKLNGLEALLAPLRPKGD